MVLMSGKHLKKTNPPQDFMKQLGSMFHQAIYNSQLQPGAQASKDR